MSEDPKKARNDGLDELRATLVRLIIEASDGSLSATELAQASGSLRAFNYSSLSYIRLLDSIENELGLYLDPETDDEMFATVDGIAGLLAQQCLQGEAADQGAPQGGDPITVESGNGFIA